MISGGELRINPREMKDTNNDGKINDAEMSKGVIDEATTQPVANQTVDLGSVKFDGQTYDWQNIKEALKNAADHHPITAGSNLSFDEVKTELKKILLGKLDQEISKVRQAQAELDAEKAKTPKNNNTIKTKQDALTEAKNSLERTLNQARAAGVNTQRQVTEASNLLGRAAPEGGAGSGSANFKAQTANPQVAMPPAPQAGAPTGGQGAAGAPQAAALTAGPNYSGYGPNGLSGMSNPTSAAYANALAFDASAGFGDAITQSGNARREGQKLMMLFYFFARMAESGDLGAMYQFIKFITYIIAKDKARQNIQLGSKLIQLQDVSRKATDALLKSDPNDSTAFLKAQQQTKGITDAVSTSQKLIADTLQEFAHVVESLVNSSKNLLDAWGRVLRTASSR